MKFRLYGNKCYMLPIQIMLKLKIKHCTIYYDYKQIQQRIHILEQIVDFLMFILKYM